MRNENIQVGVFEEEESYRLEHIVDMSISFFLLQQGREFTRGGYKMRMVKLEQSSL